MAASAVEMGGTGSGSVTPGGDCGLDVARELGRNGRGHYAEIIAVDDPTCAYTGGRCLPTDDVGIGRRGSAPGWAGTLWRRSTIVAAVCLAFVVVAALAGCGDPVGQADEEPDAAGSGTPVTESGEAAGSDDEAPSSTDDDSSDTEPGDDAGDQPDGEAGGGGNGGGERGGGNGGGLDDERERLESVPGLLDDDEAAQIVGGLDGQLAIGDGNVVAVARPDGNSYRALDGDSRLIASQPTWSRAGDKLVWSSVSAGRQLARIQPFDDDGAPDGVPLDSEAPGRPVFYYQWTDDDETIMYLRSSPTGTNIEAGALLPGRPIEAVDDGAPFFVSWSPSGDRVAANVDNRSVRIYDKFASAARNGGSSGDDVPVYELLMDGTDFSAPAWIDETTVLIMLDGWLTSLVLDGDGREQDRVRLTEAATPVRFVVSPDRRRVAYQAVDGIGPGINQAGLSMVDDRAEPPVPSAAEPGTGWDPVAGPRPVQRSGLPSLVVFDLETGNRETVTDEPALAWEWSPDSTKLAWLRPESNGGRSARWRFWSVTGEQPAGDLTAPLVTISAKEALNYLPFFAQYTQSVNRWSPDSTAFAMAGTITPASGPPRDGIWIHLVDQPARPVPVAEGDFVTWGSGPTPPAVGSSPA